MKTIFSQIVLLLLLSSSLTAQWYQQYSGVDSNLYSLFSIDGQTAWATGANGVIIKTSNSGTTWVQKPSGTSYSISFVHFFNQSEGILAGSGGTIMKTYNGGDTWESISGGTYNRLQEGCFVNDSVGYICGDAGILLKTTNRGETWATSVISSSNFAFIYFTNENTGYATTEWTGQIWKTTDAGSSWILKQTIGNFSVWQVYFVDENNGWVVGEYGTIAHTTDAGESWNTQNSGTGVNLRSVYFHTPDVGWVVGKDETRLRTTDGGNTWIHDHTGYVYEYLYIYFYDNSIGWICGTSGVILQTGGIPPVTNVFEKTFGGVNSERGVAIDNTIDGGYVIGGSTASFTSSEEMYLLKLDSTGSIQWTKLYSSFGYDRIHGVKQTTDGGYYLSGYIEDGNELFDMALAKVDAAGNIVWAKYSGAFEAEELRRLCLTPDGGIFAAGYNASFGVGDKDVQVVKLSVDGNIEWANTYGTLYEDFNTSCVLSSDGSYVLSGAVDISGAYEIRPTLIKLDSLGNIIWAKYYSGFIEDWARDLVETFDGGYLIIGDTRSYGLGGSRDVYLIKLNSTGDVEWAKSLGGIGSDVGYSVVLSSDNKYVVAGYTNSYGFGEYDAFLMKLNTAGTLEWFHTYGGYTNDYAIDATETPDNGFAFTGIRSANTLGGDDVYLVKTDANGFSNCAVGVFSPNIFTISNLQAVNLNMGTLNYSSTANLNLTTFNPNSGENTSCATIPVELKSFNYQLNRNNVLLTWSTATETNNMGFEIERGTDKSTWITIGFVEGKGTTTESQEYKYTDDLFGENSEIVFYRLKQIDYDGTVSIIGELEVTVKNIPSTFILEQNYPNPFNPVTIINYALPQDAFINLSIYNSLGERLRILEGGFKEAGYHWIEFDGSDLPSGIYFYSLLSEEFIMTKKMVLLR